MRQYATVMASVAVCRGKGISIRVSTAKGVNVPVGVGEGRELKGAEGSIAIGHGTGRWKRLKYA